MALILVVEDEKLLRWSMQQHLEGAGHTVHLAENLAQAADHLNRHQPDLMILDLRLPDGHGLDFFEASLDRLESTVVLIVTAVGQVEHAVRAMKLGAIDFLTKPVDSDELVRLVEKSVAKRGDLLEVLAARQHRERELGMDIVAESPSFRETLSIAADVAKSTVTSVLVQGASGTGKGVIARYIHAHSDRHQRPFLQMNCAAIPEQLMESELFGHEKGAFTDAKASKRGTLELANGGTVLLDEIGELKPGLQAKLLHVLEERFFRRVGGVREIHVDVRVLALTNRDLRAMVRSGTFRDDLFYRLNVFPISVPPLRERREDIIPLARHFLQALQTGRGILLDEISRQAENTLMAYSWPGNVRELRNAIERAVILEHGTRVTASSLILDGPEPAANDMAEESGLPSGIVSLPELERVMIHRALGVTNQNCTRAAELLGITRYQLRYRLKSHGIPEGDSEEAFPVPPASHRM